MSTPVGDYSHELAGRKSWPALQPLDYNDFNVASGQEPYAVAGRCGCLNSNNEWTAGVTGTSTSVPAPLFLLRSLTSFDVALDRTNSYGGGVGSAYNMSALVGFGAFELYTTEFDASGYNFPPNKPLKAPTASQTTNDAATTGLLYAAKNWNGGNGGAVTIGTETVVGVTSFGTARANFPRAQYANFTNPFGRVPNLAFWPHYIHGSA